MPLGANHLFTRDHFEAHRGTAPAHLCELVVHCLELVAQLAVRGLSFRFKGGNSLLLLLEEPRRFSIDVDVVTTEPRERLAALVDAITAEGAPFLRSEARLPKTKPWLPMVSFKLFFRSFYQAEVDGYVMLDAVLEAAPYPGVRRRVRSGTIYQADVEVEVPSVSGLMGDKLLTLGPSTLGIPLGKGKEAQRLKHVFDVARLSREDHTVAAVRESVAACLVQENRIQEKACTLAEIVRDTERFCSAPLAPAAPPDPATLEPGYLQEIAAGFEPFRQHLFRGGYEWTSLQQDCRSVLSVLSGIAGQGADG